VTTTPSAEESAAGSAPTSAATARSGAGATPSRREGGSERSRRAEDEATRTDQPAARARAASDADRPSTVAPVDDDGDGDDGATGARRLLGYRRQRFEARKVRRLIRHVDPWSMLKLSLLLGLCMWLILMIASVIMWTVARNAGTIASIENFVNSSLSLQDWRLDGDFIFRQFGLITLLLALGFAAATVIASLVFNLVSDIIGGVWVSVIEEETARPVAESKPSGPLG
jgi:hypothetical protein